MGRKLDQFLAEVGAEVKVMGREMVNDVRQTAHEVYFGKPEHAMEPGTPMNPTQREVYEQKHETEKDMDKDM